MANRDKQAKQAQLNQINQSQRPGHKGKKPSLIAVASALIAKNSARAQQHAH